MNVSRDATPHAPATPDPATSPSEPEARPVGSQGAPSPSGSSGPVQWTARQRRGMVVQAAVALLLIGVAVWISIQGLDDRDVRLHHLEHAAFLCGGGLLGLLVGRLRPLSQVVDWERRPWLRLIVIGILVVEPLVLMAVMIPFTSPWIDAHPPVHALEHLSLIVLGGILGLLGYLFSFALGWLLVLVTAAMMATFGGMSLAARLPTPVSTTMVGARPGPGTLPSLQGYTKINAWVYSNQAQRHVVITVVAAETAANAGFNFDGFSSGQAKIIVPVNWAVDLEFSNQSVLPHSAGITTSAKTPLTLQRFGSGIAATPNPTGGTAHGVTQLVSFVADHAGSYILACLVPGHVESGMWDHFTVSSTARVPSIQIAK